MLCGPDADQTSSATTRDHVVSLQAPGRPACSVGLSPEKTSSAHDRDQVVSTQALAGDPSALWSCIDKGKAMQIALTSAMSPDARPEMYAVVLYNGFAQLLCAAGASNNKQCTWDTAFIMPSRCGHLEVVRLLSELALAMRCLAALWGWRQQRHSSAEVLHVHRLDAGTQKWPG